MTQSQRNKIFAALSTVIAVYVVALTLWYGVKLFSLGSLSLLAFIFTVLAQFLIPVLLLIAARTLWTSTFAVPLWVRGFLVLSITAHIPAYFIMGPYNPRAFLLNISIVTSYIIPILIAVWMILSPGKTTLKRQAND